ncbi:MAG TPA: YjjG family noncanonical pyrimidine nucleotidase [Flavobacteriales bacterium]|nr:YjjG family noncanonical pyrimidine nucleotidase [Flavobacteriales bacterium]
MKQYHHVFFDLDHTLWDFRTNSREVLTELHAEFALAERGIAYGEFLDTYEEINEGLWERYEAGRLDKAVLRVLRFRNTFLRFGVKDDRTAAALGEAYLARTPQRKALNPGALQLLQQLHGNVGLHIITNGFDATQRTKIASSGIGHLFSVVLTSEGAGMRKPDPRIFHTALKRAGASAEESLMVGDNAVADIRGARTAGIDQAHYAPGQAGDPEATFRIAHFDELRAVLVP